MPFLPRNFVVPARIDTERFVMRSITIHDAFKDYDAVMSSREHLWSRFGEIWGWPAEDMTIEHNIVDLGWHQKEFKLRSSFDYALMTPDESQLLGCVYIDPPSEEGTDAEVWFWARSSEVPRGLEVFLGAFLPQWLSTAWPFAIVSINGLRHTLERAGGA
ncbi:MAG: GNAT family N-acetyltransferase [Betaproteobacteria bacterium]